LPILLVSLLLPVSTAFFNVFDHYFSYFYWPPAKPLAGTHGILRFRGNSVENWVA